MFLRHVASSTFAAAGVAICGLLATIATSRWLGVTGKGHLALILNAIALVLPLTNLGVKQATAYLLGKENEPEARVVSAQARILPVSVLLTMIGALLVLQVSDAASPTLIVASCIVVFAFSRIVFDYVSGLFIARKEIYTLNLLTILRAILELTGGVIGLLVSATPGGYLVGLSAGAICAVLIAIYVVVTRHHIQLSLSDTGAGASFRYEIALVSNGIRYALPMFIMGLNYGVDVVMLGALSVTESVGLYSVAVTLVHAIWFLPNIMNFVVFSHSVSTAKAEASRYSRTVFKNAVITFFALFPVILIIGVLASRLIVLAFGAEFEGASTAFIILLPGAYVMILFKLLNGDLAARGYPQVAMKAFSVALVVNVVANIFLIPELGHAGAALASTLSYITGVVLFLLSYTRFALK